MALMKTEPEGPASHRTADLFAEDIIYGILSKLPIKSLARFRCVSKSWLNYIKDPYLRSIYVKEEPTPIIFEQFAPNKIKISFLHGMQKDPVLKLRYKINHNGTLLLGSCNGLVMVSLEQDPSDFGAYRFAVVNPLSKECHELPPNFVKIRDCHIYLDGPCHAAGIGFDDSTNTLKTVFVILKNPPINMVRTMVHSLGTSSWRKIAQRPAYPIRGEGIYGHGRLHWLTDQRNDSPVKIVWFDVKTEEFGLTDPPRPIESHAHYHVVELLNGEKGLGYNQLVDLNGDVGFAYNSPICIKLWILKEEEWVLHCSIDVPHCFDCDNDLKVSGCWNKDGDILLTCTNYSGGNRLFVYTLKAGDLQEVEQTDHPCEAYIRMYRSSLFAITNHTFRAAAAAANTHIKRTRFAAVANILKKRTRSARTKRIPAK